MWKIIQCMMQEALLRERMLLWPSNIEESQLKKWRVMEMERMITSDKRLYTIGKISKELIIFLFNWLYKYIVSLTVYKYFYYMFVKQKRFLFTESICIQIINQFYLFYFYLPGWYSCRSLASTKIWLAKWSSCPAISCSWAATGLASMTASLIFLGLFFEVFQ